MLACSVVIRGRVQGVGFRMAMVDAARAREVAGWVRNRRDGTVEAVVQGEKESIEQMLEWCRRGPSGSRVTDVATRELDADPALLTFDLRPTE